MGFLGSIGGMFKDAFGDASPLMALNPMALGFKGVEMMANAREARKGREFASGQADKQMAFQERMSSSAHQRGVADLKAAGINPMAQYGSGGSGGASTPAGAQGTAQNAKPVDLSSLMNTALEGTKQAQTKKFQEGLLGDAKTKLSYEGAINRQQVKGLELDNKNKEMDLALKSKTIVPKQKAADVAVKLSDYSKYLDVAKEYLGLGSDAHWTDVAAKLGIGALGLAYALRGGRGAFMKLLKRSKWKKPLQLETRQAINNRNRILKSKGKVSPQSVTNETLEQALNSRIHRSPYNPKNRRKN